MFDARCVFVVFLRENITKCVNINQRAPALLGREETIWLEMSPECGAGAEARAVGTQGRDLTLWS